MMRKTDNLEALYYESDDFWSHDMLRDAKQLNRIRETANLLPDDVKSILDAGCGNGAFCNFLKDNRPEIKITGMDRSKNALQHVRTEKTLGDLVSIPFADSSFDCVSCLQVLEHIKVPEYKTALRELSRVSSKYILISVPYREKIHEHVTRCPSCNTIFNYDLHLRAYDDQKVKYLFSEYGFEQVEAVNIGRYSMSVVYSLYLRLIGGKDKKVDFLNTFNSPLCPVCGFVNPNRVVKLSSQIKTAGIEPKKTESSVLKSVARKVWHALKPIFPVRWYDGYWIVALYKKCS